VIYHHFFHSQVTPTNFLTRSLVHAEHLGTTGVDLFFVLSGYLITGILLRTKETPNALLNFYMRRALRIVPLYYSCLCILYFVLPLLHRLAWTPLHTQLWLWTYTENIGLTFWTPDWTTQPPHFWSLAVEEQFYLIWPFVVFHLTDDRLKRVLWVLMAVAFLTRCAFLLLGYQVDFFTLCRMDGLCMGATIALLSRKGLAGPGLARAKLVLAILVPVSLGAQLILTGTRLPFIQATKFTLAALLCGGLLILVLDARPGTVLYAIFGNGFMRSIGKYSYGMYVIHWWLVPSGGFLPPIPRFLFVCGVTYAAAFASWHILEKPFLSLKRYFEYTRGVVPVRAHAGTDTGEQSRSAQVALYALDTPRVGLPD
jgi:peptidoglycan/LPS O-acetylase OafA/YrhL